MKQMAEKFCPNKFLSKNPLEVADSHLKDKGHGGCLLLCDTLCGRVVFRGRNEA